MIPRLSRSASICAIYFVLHIGAHFSAYLFAVAPGISIWYLPAGLAMSLMILLGPRYAPVVFCANATTAILSSSLPVWWAPILFPALITAAYASAAWFIRHYAGPVLLLSGKRGSVVFCMTTLGASAFLAVVGTGALLLVGIGTWETFLQSVFTWWVGDVSGILTVVPVAVVFLAPLLKEQKIQTRVFLRDRRLMGIILFQSLSLLLGLSLVFILEPLRQHSAFYLCFLPLIWISMQHGLEGATLATLATTIGGVLGMRFFGTTNSQITNFLLFELAAAVLGLGLGSAVSRRNRAEQSLSANEARFNRVISGAQLGLWDWDLSTQQISHNKRWAEMLGCELLSLGPDYDAWLRRVHPEDKDQFDQAMTALRDGRRQLYEIEYRVRAKDQTWRWVVSRGSVVASDPEGHPMLASGTHVDITDRKRAEAETHRLLKVIEANTDFIVTTDSSGKIIYANEAFQKSQGIGRGLELKGKSLLESVPERIGKTISSEAIPSAISIGSWQGEITVKDAKGMEIPLSLVLLAHRSEECDAVNLSFIMRDISAQKQAEAERIVGERKMLQTQKLESLGVLAGGIAHDFNNLLTVMLGNASLARFDLPADSAIHAPLEQIEKAAVSAAELCQQMLAYAGRSPLAFTQVDVTQLIDDTTHLIQITLGKKHTLTLNLARPSPLIRADASQIRQIIMNLALNASQAIGDAAGRIEIRTRLHEFSSAELGADYSDLTLPAGPYLVLEVEDSGCGMPPEILTRIFEPFFTTKFSGHGLGLAAVLGIMKSHNGGIKARSKQGEGSAFSVIFPSSGIAATQPTPATVEHQQWQGTGLVLVVDDEASVRNTIVNTLTSFGFTTLVASDGMEGIEVFRKYSSKLRFVMLDLTMPRMDGDEAFRAIHEINPDVPTILMSGFSEKQSLTRFIGDKPAAFIAKPFNHRALDACLKQLGAGTSA